MRSPIALAPTMVIVLLGCLLCTGCVKRTISITSEPPGALVWVNDREVGRTPLDIEFIYYGAYDVRLRHEGYEPLLTVGQAKAPWWDTPGADFVAEIAPVGLKSEIAWHYQMEPLNDDRSALLDRAEELRTRVLGDFQPPADENSVDAPGTQPGEDSDANPPGSGS